MDSLPATLLLVLHYQAGSLVLSNHKITVTPKGPLSEEKKNLLGLPFYIYGNMTVS